MALHTEYIAVLYKGMHCKVILANYTNTVTLKLYALEFASFACTFSSSNKKKKNLNSEQTKKKYNINKCL